MFQVRFHGRGGQGVVTSAELLAVAAFDGGLHAQAFPVFGSERTGAPVMAFCRVDDRPIRTREPIFTPDALVIQDPTLLPGIELSAPLVIVNTTTVVTAPGRVVTVPASGIVSLDALATAIEERFEPAVAAGNVAAARAAYAEVLAHA